MDSVLKLDTNSTNSLLDLNVGGTYIDNPTFITDGTSNCSTLGTLTFPSYSYTYTLPENFDLQVKQVKNGFKVKVNSDEFVFESLDNLLKFVKESFKPKKK